MSDPKDDARRLIESCFAFATELLSKQGEFYPFGQRLGCDGELVHDLVYTGDDHPDSASLIADTRKVWRAMASKNEIVATALAYECVVRAAEDDSSYDAICIAVDHVAGISINVLFPYTFEAGALSVSEGTSECRPPEVFGVGI